MRDLGVKDGLVELIKGIDKLASEGLAIKSARILYLYPATTSLRLIKAIEESLIFHNYFDMPLQHISSKVLKIMRRSGDFMKLLESMQKCPNAFIRTSFIIGHPGESEEDFKALCDFIQKYPFNRINFFAFSSEEGTKSAAMEQIPKAVIQKRLKIISQIFQEQYQKSLLNLKGQEITAILEGVSSEHEFFWSGRDMRFAPEIDGEILINDKMIQEDLKAGFYRVKITEIAGEEAIGCVVSQC